MYRIECIKYLNKKNWENKTIFSNTNYNHIFQIDRNPLLLTHA